MFLEAVNMAIAETEDDPPISEGGVENLHKEQAVIGWNAGGQRVSGGDFTSRYSSCSRPRSGANIVAAIYSFVTNFRKGVLRVNSEARDGC